MFEAIKEAVERDLAYAASSQYADPVRDALIHNYLLVEVCERLASLQSAMQKTNLPIYRKLQEDQHNGIMLAFWLDPDIAKQLALPSGESPEELHVTLCYLGNTGTFTADVEHLKTSVGKFAASSNPLSGQVGGVGRFTPSDSSDNLSPVIAMVNIPGLQEWRRQLASILDSAGVYIANDFDFNPHITLAYIDPDASMPVQNIAPLPLLFDTLWLCIGDERISYKLGALPPHESTNAQSIEAEHDQLTRTDQSESTTTLSEIHEDTGSDNNDGSTNTEDTAGQDTDPDKSRQKLAETIAAIFLSMQLNARYLTIPVVGVIYGLSDTDKHDLTEAIAKTYIAAQTWSYFHAKETTGIALSGITIKHSDALAWAHEQVTSIADTMHEQVTNFANALPADITLEVLATQMKEWLDNFADYKTKQIVNVTWGTGADIGTNAALTDILDAATDPNADNTISTDNIRVQVLPAESSSDACKAYAGNDYSIDEYFSLGIHWPFHPNCPHHIEAYVDMGNADSSDVSDLLGDDEG